MDGRRNEAWALEICLSSLESDSCWKFIIEPAPQSNTHLTDYPETYAYRGGVLTEGMCQRIVPTST